MERRTHILNTVLSLRCDVKFLTRITLSGVNLRWLPSAILHEHLEVLDIRENNLDVYPVEEGCSQNRLGWRCINLNTLNLSKNLFTYIHPDIFRLPCLSKLFMNGNKLERVPVEMWTAPLLRTLELGNNMIFEIPCPTALPRSDQMSLFSPLSSIPHVNNYLQSWKRSYVSYDARSSNDLKSQVGFALDILDLSENHLDKIPGGLPCLAPLLRTLKLAHNQITNLGTFADYPSLLQSLDVSHNGITRGIEPVSETTDIECLQSRLVNERHIRCLHYEHKILSSLKFLYLCGNHIEDLHIEDQGPTNIESSPTHSTEEEPNPPEEADPPGLFYPKLQALRISDNSLVRFPENIHHLTKLRELVVSGNARIMELPPSLHKLTRLFTFRYDGIQDPIIRELAHLRTSAEVLYYLKARELK